MKSPDSRLTRIFYNIVLLFLFLVSPGLCAENNDPLLKESIREQIDIADKVTWNRFYLKETHLFYDYLTSYEDGKSLAHLPTKEEVQKQYPNVYGYGTGMEDCMISAGVLLVMIVDQYSVTQSLQLKEEAFDVYQGIKLCCTAHGVKGFVARAVCHEDLKSIYINSSRDQYTHAVHGLWCYAKSPLCSPKTKKEISQILSGIADRMTANVTSENNYDSLRADGTPDERGISRMWKVKGHEAARLPMIYAAAWDLTANPEYHRLWKHYLPEAVNQSFTVEDWQPTYAFLQMQNSLDLLLELETEEIIIQKIREVMKGIAARCSKRAASSEIRGSDMDLTMLCTNWRTDEGLSSDGKYRQVWYCIRESGEAALAQLFPGIPFSQDQQEILARNINRIDFENVSSNGIFYLQAAYWKYLALKKKGQLN